MAKGDQINLGPHFKEEGPTLPCEGQAGDLYVFSRVGKDEPDTERQGSAELWFCTKGAMADGRNAIWKRVAFNDMKTCAVPPVKAPQDTPELKEG